MSIIPYIIAFLLFAGSAFGFDINETDCDDGDATTWCIQTSDTSFDGDTDCGGACSGGDTLYLEGGARGDLDLIDLDGSGSYITVKNEPTNRVVMTHDHTGLNGVLVFDNCKYVDFRGDNNDSHSWSADSKAEVAYGIKIIMAHSTSTPSTTVWVSGESDHLKIGYLEITWDGTAQGTGSSGIVIQDISETAAWTYDTIEIHHNYIHDALYAGLYLGHNQPHVDDYPYTANLNVHHNLVEDSGAYGGNIKGTATGSISTFAYNIIRRTAQICSSGNCNIDTVGGWRNGYKFSYAYGTSYVNVYNNRIEGTEGPCFFTFEANHNIYNNVLLGCGADSCVGTCTDTPAGYKNGITIETNYSMPGTSNDREVEIYNNTIVESDDYGIRALNAESAANDKDNIITEPGTDYRDDKDSCTYRTDCIEEGSGDYADTEIADADNVGFATWSDDSDYSNDNFDLEAGHSVGPTGATGFPTLDYDGVTRNSPSVDGAYEEGFDIDQTDCADGDATTWCSQTSDANITDADCGGSCDGGDTIYLEGGTRTVDLDINGIDGSGNYITITNYTSDPNGRIIFSKQDNTPAITFSGGASWINLTGDGLSSHAWTEQCDTAGCYGILINQQISESAGGAMIRFEDSDSDNIKIGYIEIDGSNTTYDYTSGIQVQSSGLTNSVTLNNYELHHNYIHDVSYTPMYLGNNRPPVDLKPYVANFLIHDNLLVDSGAYGLTYKGIGTANTDSKIYNNFVLPSNRASGNSTRLNATHGALAAQGIGVAYPYAQEIEVYNNWVEKSYGPGLRFINGDHDNVVVYNNVVLGCGTSDDSVYGQGILYAGLDITVYNILVYNNTIVDAVRYGIFSSGGVDSGTHKDNLILAPTMGYSSGDVDFVEGSGAYANTESATDPGFVSWDEDNDYSDGDDFDLAGGHSVGPTGATGFPILDYAGVTRNSPSVDGAYEFDFDGASQIQSTNLQGISFAP